jgi:alginate O-acetyltransferase complex protein AlgI
VSFTPPFYLLLAAAGIAFYLIPGRFRALYLLVLSYTVYGLYATSSLYLLLLVVATASSYAVGLGIAYAKSQRAKSRLMLLGVSAIVAAIVAFKAMGAATGVLLPLGLSYYSFKLISYLVEVYWDEASVERNPVIFSLYPAFFPQIVSGPIQRPDTFFCQMRDVMGRTASGPQIEAGFRYILGGLMLKLLIGDRLADFIAKVDAAHNDFTHATLLATVACYTLQLYADFAGYTNIALGVGKIFGVEGPPNFKAPFAAVNIQEMWRRWHMSLTSWLTDYLFTPLSMSLRSFRQAGLIASIMLNMVLIGVWHGFTFNYLVFGVLHGIFLSTTVLVLVALRKRQKGGAATKRAGGVVRREAISATGRVLTFVLMSFTQIFFHSATWDQAISILKQVLCMTPSGPLIATSLGPGVALSTLLCAAIALYDGSGAPGSRQVAAKLDSIVPRRLQYGACLFLMAILTVESGAGFVYGRF